MAKKTTKQMRLHDMAVRLCEGGEVLYQGYGLKAIAVPEGVDPCDLCQMDCLCRAEMVELCAECDSYERRFHLLYLANEQPPIVADSAR